MHLEAAGFADHDGFTIDVLAAYRPTRGKGRVERQVLITRDHVMAGRSFDSIGRHHVRRRMSPHWRVARPRLVIVDPGLPPWRPALCT